MEPTVGGPRTARGAVLLLVVVTLLAALLPLLPAAAAAPVPGAGLSSPVAGNVSGPRYVAVGSTNPYWINGTGGPAMINGLHVGNITWKASLTGQNLTGVSFSPNSSTITSPGTPGRANLTVGNVTEVLTLTVEVNSSYQGKSSTINITKEIQVVVPYVVRAVLVAGAEKVLAFKLAILLDGTVVGNVSVPTIAAGGAYNLSFRFASGGLAAGNHTFSISLAGEHGLVTFAGGATSFSQTFYVAGPPPNYGLWAVVGIAVFVGILFIFGTRVAARRRPTSK